MFDQLHLKLLQVIVLASFWTSEEECTHYMYISSGVHRLKWKTISKHNV